MLHSRATGSLLVLSEAAAMLIQAFSNFRMLDFLPEHY